MEEITLLIRGKIFNVKKEVLSKYSDYFRAMFSGGFIENQQREISIDILDPNIVNIILQYMNSDLINLSKYCLSTIDEIAFAAEFLQINDLRQHIQLTLQRMKMCESNWMEVMAIAESYSYLKVEQLSAAVGLYSFKSMKPEYVSTINKLAWYLSHPYLDAESEFDVFNFGFQWISNNEAGDDALLVILACLDFKRITHQDIQGFKNSLRPFENSLASKVVDCLYELSSNGLELSEIEVNTQKLKLCEKFTETVWTETVDIIKESKSRLFNNSLIALVRDYTSSGDFKHHLTKFNQDTGFETWLPDLKNTYNLTSWGLTKLVILYEEYVSDKADQRREVKVDDTLCTDWTNNGVNLVAVSWDDCVSDTADHKRKVKVYDTLKQDWTIHDINLPPVIYTWGDPKPVIAVVKDSLYIIEVVNRGAMVTAIEYDLKKKIYREIAALPEYTLPRVCTHQDKLYVALSNNIYCYDDTDAIGLWRVILEIGDIVIVCITSYKDYIYCTKHSSTDLFRFRPDVDKELELVTFFSWEPYALINVGNKLLAITYTEDQSFEEDLLLVEEYFDDDDDEKMPEVIYRHKNFNLCLEIMAGFGTSAIMLPPLCKKLSEYHNKYMG